ncbi:ectonucleotide pyrophosphatase/phosphodiesterase [Lysobacter sp. GX 14042]|uniref:alkaline phosphatase family protein n=1 Tax=Lysobacter sp. GX 14042 TaxID=2907155 RepID=UPI001F231D61|nr:ectonucleotide pyrophosphatase/phosphodiesterase [Lysobacter sp. GX 14042]MCE7033249.1 ectonucleotide pyrophosphatase/phosphodiesterase [Lysobacter sp. GX 14042]
MSMFRTAALAASLLLAACGTTPGPETAPQGPAQAAAELRPSVLLVSIDGFRADYLDLGLTPNLQRLADGGVRAQWMTPSYPSLTFPNHYTLVTGLRPDHHGVIHNTMRDPVLGKFRINDREAVGSGAWWGGEPIWVAAEKAGLPTAAMFWVGSEAPVAGVRPTRWSRFDAGVGVDERIDRVLGWLAEPEETRPRLATLYFEHLDSAGHRNGPRAPETLQALREMDAAIGRLVEGLAARGLQDRVDLVVVSDHGMAEVPPGHVVVVEDMVEPADVELVSAGQSVGFQPVAGRTAAAEARLLGRHDHYECWRRGELPQRWHFGTHPRVPAIVCQMDEGWDARPREYAARGGDRPRGSHGYDPALPSMRAIFIADGPSFVDGLELPPIDNVDVYPLLAELLGIEPAAHDGDPAALRPALDSAGAR